MVLTLMYLLNPKSNHKSNQQPLPIPTGQSESMARTSFCRLARSSLLPATAAAAATTALAASTFADEKGGSDGGRRGVGVRGSPTPRSLAAFAHRPRGATICEAPHRPPSSSRYENAAVYLPADPAEPALAPGAGADADGRGSKGGMWGEERDGSVSITATPPPPTPLPDFAPHRYIFRIVVPHSPFPLGRFAHLLLSPSSLVSRKIRNERRGRHPYDVRKRARKKKFHGLFPRRQLWRPAVEYPLWDYNWDGRQPPPPPISRADGGEDGKMAEEAKQQERLVRKEGVTRHVILIRHGQYDETSKVRKHPLKSADRKRNAPP